MVLLFVYLLFCLFFLCLRSCCFCFVGVLLACLVWVLVVFFKIFCLIGVGLFHFRILGVFVCLFVCFAFVYLFVSC